MAYQIFEIGSPDDLDRVEIELDECYEPGLVIQQLKAGLDPCCRKIILESAYNDKDYRSTYYNYYAKKGYKYQTHCLRLHFFDGNVQLDADSLELQFDVDESRNDASSTYFGYMVLRPTRQNTIGRTVMSPSAIQGFHGTIIEANHKVHLLGHKLVVAGFPYMSQHMDISVCAHVTCWAILRHYSERFSKYAERLTHDITRMAHEFDPGGLLPSTGLHVHHAERVFAGAGAFPILIARDGTDDGLFYRQLFAYVESGFPLFAELKRIAHAVTVIGHGGFGSTVPSTAPCHFAFDFVDNLVVVDDNFLPYKAIPRTVGGSAPDYDCGDITAVIVPLPDKIYYPAENVDGLAMLLATEDYLGFNHDGLGEPVVRYFLTTASHLRWFMTEHRSQLDPQLVSIAMQLTLPQFVWLIEIASCQQWKNGTIATRVIVDATASPAEEFPIFLMHDEMRAYVWDRGGQGSEQYVKLSSPPNTPMSRMDRKFGNLVTH